MNQYKAQAVPQRKPANPYAGLTASQWAMAGGFGLIIAAIGWPFYAEISIWIGVIIVVLAFTMTHMVLAGEKLLFLPHIAIFISALQYVLAAWVNWYYPATDPVYNIGEDTVRYIDYAGPVVLAVLAGWVISLWKLRASVSFCKPTPALLVELDVLFWGGTIVWTLQNFFTVGRLGFLLELLANLRFVGALGWMLVGARGWRWRMATVIFLLVFTAAGSGMFHTLILWGFGILGAYAYRYRPPRWTITAWLLLAALLLPAMQQAKWRLREVIRFEESSIVDETNFDTAIARFQLIGKWSSYLIEGTLEAAMLNFDPDFIADVGVRYNQGWIINRVMETVPDHEPYAKGRTLLEAAEASVLPRVLAPHKIEAGGKARMERFAGLALQSGTSMNLGYAGEMYANFGRWGGVAMCGLYAMVLGLLLRMVTKKASKSMLWWIFVPYVGHLALKAEDGVAEVMNWVVKSLLICVLVYLAFPALRAALSGHVLTPPESQRAAVRRRRRSRQRVSDASSNPEPEPSEA